MPLDRSKLLSPRAQSDGSIIAQCPACAAMGRDRSRNHLRVWLAGEFNCAVYSGDLTHNRAIKAYLDDPTAEMPVFIDPEPRLTVDKVYPEETLRKLIPDPSYWVGRGASKEVVTRLEGGLAPLDGGKLKGRFVFPVRALDGRIMGFTGRLVEENTFAPKWKHLFRVSVAVWPWLVNGPAIRAAGICVLVESVGDLLAIQSAGIDNVLCIWGLKLHGKVISTLLGAGVRRIVISLNNDGDANKGNGAATKARDKLLSFWGPEAVTIRLPRSKDWGKCMESPEGAAELAEFRAEVEASWV